MKKIFYLSGIMMFSVSLMGAVNTIEEKMDNNQKVFTIEKVEVQNDQADEAVFGWFKGRCLDGHTFSFHANSREEAQGYVNGYCAARDEEADAD